MSDPTYVNSIKVSAGPFTVRTGLNGERVYIKRVVTHNAYQWGMTLEDVELLYRAIGEYLHMRSRE